MKRQRRNKKIIVGLTGSFGTGKTTVAKIFKSYGTEVIDADKIAHQVIRPHTKIYKRIISIFRKEVLKKDKTIDRNKLAKIVFNNRKLLKRLNKIMHPQIIRIMKNQIKLAKSDLIVLDTPLLIEAGLKDLVDKLIVVKAKRSQQIERIIKKSSLSKEEILKRIKNQIPLQVKVRWADFVIDNSGTIANTRKQVKTVWRSLVPTLGRDSGLICKPVITGKLRRLLWKN